tara:strand:- start:3066 stop:3248 length:183 start_codon:yes stop_codon:yes gene_type:complete
MEAKIKTISELQIEANQLIDKLDLMKRQRTDLSQSISQTRKQIAILEERILNNTQYELYK